MMAVAYSLQTSSRDQERWSLTANRLKAQVSQARVAVLILAIAGAVLATFSNQISGSYPHIAQLMGYAGAGALASIAGVRQLYLSQSRLQAWVLARSASEALKRELFRYRTSTGPYSGEDRDALLADRRDQIVEKVRIVQGFAAEPQDEAPRGNLEPLSVDGYFTDRLQKQRDWYRKNASAASVRQNRFSVVQNLLAIVGGAIGLITPHEGFHGPESWVPVITTILGALGAHVLAGRYGQLAIGYRATADRLDGIGARWSDRRLSLEQLVDQCEAALAQENQAWITGIDEARGTTAPESASPQSARAATTAPGS